MQRNWIQISNEIYLDVQVSVDGIYLNEVGEEADNSDATHQQHVQVDLLILYIRIGLGEHL